MNDAAPIPEPSTRHPFDRLPSVYEWTDSEQGDWLRRLLTIPAELLAEVDGHLRRFSALLDPARTPPEARLWLARLLSLPVDVGLPSDRWPSAIAHAPELWRWRGTLRGVRLGMRVLLEDGCDLVELAPEDSPRRVGMTRLSRHGWSRPNLVVVVEPSSPLAGPTGMRRLTRVIRLLAPAHVSLGVRTRRPHLPCPPATPIGRADSAPGRLRIRRADERIGVSG